MRGGPSRVIVGEGLRGVPARDERRLQFVASVAEITPTMPAFDAQAARALARRTHGVREILAEMKTAIVVACERGEFEAAVKLPDAQVVPAGTSSNNAAFLVEHLLARDLPAWAESVRHAAHAGYNLRPSWCGLDNGAGCDGVLLSWSLVLDEPETTPQLMSAASAYRLAQASRAHHRWVEQAQDAVRRAAVKGASHCIVHDEATPGGDAAWLRRRELLEQAGFATELVPAQRGAALMIRW